MKLYANDSRDLSRAPTLADFLRRYRQFIRNSAAALKTGGKLAILMGDYCDREEDIVSLTFHTKRIAFDCGLTQHSTDIIRFSHGASSSRKVYRSSFIPGLHDVLDDIRKTRVQGVFMTNSFQFVKLSIDARTVAIAAGAALGRKLPFHEADDDIDGSVEVTSRVHVQVGTDYLVVSDWKDDAILQCWPLRHSLSLILADFDEAITLFPERPK